MMVDQSQVTPQNVSNNTVLPLQNVGFGGNANMPIPAPTPPMAPLSGQTSIGQIPGVGGAGTSNVPINPNLKAGTLPFQSQGQSMIGQIAGVNTLNSGIAVPKGGDTTAGTTPTTNTVGGGVGHGGATTQGGAQGTQGKVGPDYMPDIEYQNKAGDLQPGQAGAGQIGATPVASGAVSPGSTVTPNNPGIVGIMKDALTSAAKNGQLSPTDYNNIIQQTAIQHGANPATLTPEILQQFKNQLNLPIDQLNNNSTVSNALSQMSVGDLAAGVAGKTISQSDLSTLQSSNPMLYNATVAKVSAIQKSQQYNNDLNNIKTNAVTQNAPVFDPKSPTGLSDYYNALIDQSGVVGLQSQLNKTQNKLDLIDYTLRQQYQGADKGEISALKYDMTNGMGYDIMQLNADISARMQVLNGQYGAAKDALSYMNQTMGAVGSFFQATGNMPAGENVSSQQQTLSGMKGAGLTNNNPGNIKDQGFGSPTGVGNNGFAKFATPEDGFDALVAKIKNSQTNKSSQYYGTTLSQYIAKYAPSSDGNNPIAYTNDVASKLGVNGNTPVSQLDPTQLAAAIAKHDSGYDYSTYGQFRGGGQQQGSQIDTSAPGYATQPVPNAGGWTQSQIDIAAVQLSNGDTPKYSPNSGLAQQQYKAANTRMGQLNPGGNIAANQAIMGSLSTSLGKQTDMLNTMKKSENTVNDNVKILLNAADGVNNNSSPILNQWVNTAKGKYLGSVELGAYKTALQTVRSEYAVILGKGESTVNAQQDAAKMIPDNVSKAQLQGIINTLQTNSTNVINESQKTVDDIQTQMKGAGAGQQKSLAGGVNSAMDAFMQYRK